MTCRIVLAAGVTGVLVAAASLLPFAIPQGDDVCRLVKLGFLGKMTATFVEYRGWNGRWLSIGLQYLLHNTGSEAHYGGILLFTTLVLAGAIFALFQIALSPVRPTTTAALTAAFFALYFSSAPAPGESFYWLTGAVENAVSLGELALSVAVFLYGLGRASPEQPPWRRITRALVLAPLAFAAGGLHELYASLMLIPILWGAWQAFRKHDTPHRLWWILYAGCLAGGIAVVVLAPGSARRAAYYAANRSLGTAVYLTLRQWVDCLAGWVFDPRFLVASVAFVLWLPGWKRRPAWMASLPTVRPLFLAIGLGLLAGLFVPTYAMAQHVPGRTLNGLYFLFLIAWATLLAVWSEGQGKAFLRRIAPNPIAAPIAAAALGLALFLTGNTPIAVHDRLHLVKAYHEEIAGRGKLVKEALARGEKELEVPPYDNLPRSFLKGDIILDKEYFANRCVAYRYGLRSIALDPDRAPAAK